MKLLLTAFCVSFIALWGGPAFTENALDLTLGANIASHTPYDIFEMHYCATNIGTEPATANLTVTLWKGTEIIGTSQFEVLLATETPYTASLALPISDSVPADMYVLSVTGAIGSAKDEARAGIILDAANNVIAFAPPDPIVATESVTWGAIKGLYR
jgi:hypothetical protein